MGFHQLKVQKLGEQNPRFTRPPRLEQRASSALQGQPDRSSPARLHQRPRGCRVLPIRSFYLFKPPSESPEKGNNIGKNIPLQPPRNKISMT